MGFYWVVCVEGFEGVHGGMKLEKEMWEEEGYLGFMMKKSCASQSFGFMQEKKNDHSADGYDLK